MVVRFYLTEFDKNYFLGVLKDFYKFMDGKTETEATDLAEVAYENLIYGNGLDEVPFDETITDFAERVRLVTRGYYMAAKNIRGKYKIDTPISGPRTRKPKTAPQIPASPTPNVASVTSYKEEYEKDVKQIKDNLLTEYPSLRRKDLVQSVDNYCKLQVEINQVLNSGAVLHEAKSIKDLIDSQLRLGSYLGIDEEAKAKAKANEDKQSIAALSQQFQRTVDEFPELMNRMRYKELRMLIQKLERQELSKKLFELPAYAGMSIDEARQFVCEHEAEYEGI